MHLNGQKTDKYTNIMLSTNAQANNDGPVNAYKYTPHTQKFLQYVLHFFLKEASSPAKSVQNSE